MALSSSSLTNSYSDSPNRSRRMISSTGSRTKVELHQVDVQLQKEIGRLERQQNAAVNNIANHQQAMKMTWRKLEQKRAAESPLSSSSKETISSSPTSKRGLFHSSTKLNAATNVWKPEVAPPSGSKMSPLVVAVTGDVHHRRVRGPPPSSSNRAVSSPYLSSPYNMRRTIPGSTPPKFQEASGGSGSPLGASSPPVVMSNQDVSDKDTLLRASKLMGVESSSQGPQNFKEFYSTGHGGTVERSSSAASMLVSSALDQSLSEARMKDELSQRGDHETSDSNIPADGELTMAQMFDQIKHCRYIRRYHPDGTALEEYF